MSQVGSAHCGNQSSKRAVAKFLANTLICIASRAFFQTMILVNNRVNVCEQIIWSRSKWNCESLIHLYYQRIGKKPPNRHQISMSPEKTEAPESQEQENDAQLTTRPAHRSQ
jgi:hypothetical protein